MVALLTRLQLTLTLRVFKADRSKIVGLVILVVYLAAMLGGLLVGEYLLSGSDPITVGLLTTSLMSVVTLLWPILMVLLGHNDMLSPSRFALYPVRASDLQPGMLVAMMLTVGGVVMSIMTGGFVLAWSATPLGIVISLLAGLMGLAFAALLARTLLALIASTLASRKFRDWAMVTLGLLIIVAAFAAQGVSALFTSSALSLQRFAGVAQVAGWTPFGWAWSLPWDAATGGWIAGSIKICLLAATSAWLWRLWQHHLARALVSLPSGSASSSKVKTQSFLDRLMPDNAIGGIGGRTFRYWMRDPRRKVQGAALLIVPVVFSFPIVSGPAGSELGMLVVPPITIALVGISIVSSEICYDGSALFEEVLSGVRGIEDRLGRLLGLGVLLVPFTAVLTGAALVWSGAYEYTVLMISAMVAVLGVSAGVGSWAGAIWTYPMPPIENGIGGSRGNMSAVLGMMIASLIEGVLLLLVIGVSLLSFHYQLLGWLAPVINVGFGVGILIGGARLGGRHLDRHWPEVLRAVTWSKK